MKKAVGFLVLLGLCQSRAFFLEHLLSSGENADTTYEDPNCAGQCMLCATCWLNGGKITSYFCGGGLLQICCERQETGAEARKINYWPGQETFNDVEPLQEIHFGDVNNDPECGRVRISSRRVVGGNDAGFGRYPWQALIRVGNSRCGGALVNKRHVVTAGHCVYNTPAYKVKVFLGEYSLKQDTEPLRREEFSVMSIQRHPYYRFSPQADRYDVAVLRLGRQVQYRDHIRPICLPEKRIDEEDDVDEDTVAMVAGWGAMKPDSKERPVNLQTTDVRVVKSDTCEEWHRKNHIDVRIHEDMMCAGHEYGGKDACQGDSGGPLMTQQDGKWTLIGLVSAGFSCARAGQPGIYHRVAKTSDWISYASRHIFDSDLSYL